MSWLLEGSSTAQGASAGPWRRNNHHLSVDISIRKHVECFYGNSQPTTFIQKNQSSSCSFQATDRADTGASFNFIASELFT